MGAGTAPKKLIQLHMNITRYIHIFLMIKSSSTKKLVMLRKEPKITSKNGDMGQISDPSLLFQKTKALARAPAGATATTVATAATTVAVPSNIHDKLRLRLKETPVATPYVFRPSLQLKMPSSPQQPRAQPPSSQPPPPLSQSTVKNEPPKKSEVKSTTIKIMGRGSSGSSSMIVGKGEMIMVSSQMRKIGPTTAKFPVHREEPQLTQMWSEKYRPKSLEHLIGNHEQITQIREWFTQFKAKNTTIKKALLFSGCPGTSKTTVAHVILREFGYDVKEYNASDVRSKKLVEENLDKLITMEQIDKHFREDFQPFGIIMDEVDGMSSGDKGGMSQLIKTINPNRGKRCVKKVEKQKVGDRWIPPIICICNNNYDKKINELKKDCLEIKFSRPTISDLCLVIDQVIKHEHMSLTEDAKSFVAELAQADYRRLMFLLQNFSNIKKSPIEKKDLYDYYDIISKKTLDLNSFDITNKIFQTQSRVEDILKLYDTDKSLLPMMIHENYITVVNAQNTTLKNKLINCQQCINSVINGDMIEKMMYNTQKLVTTTDSWALFLLFTELLFEHLSQIEPRPD